MIKQSCVMGYNTRIIHNETVSAVNHSIPDDLTFYESMAVFFKNFSDTTRLRIIFALLASEMCVSDIAITLNMQHSAISHQLSKMMHSGIIRQRRSGKTVFYSVNPEIAGPIIKTAFRHLKD